jgi:hypothetical protein
MLSPSLSTSSLASSFQYYVSSLDTVTGISLGANAGGAAGAADKKRYSALIDEKYVGRFFDMAARELLVSTLKQGVRTAYATSYIGLNQVSSVREGVYQYAPLEEVRCEPPFRANYKDVFVTSIGISRFSVYRNDYDEFTQILVPVTYTVRFIKLDGAEIIFSKSTTVYTTGTFLRREVIDPTTNEITEARLAELRAAVLSDGTKIVTELVADAKSRFNPQAREVKVVEKKDGYFVFDKGSEIGFSSKDRQSLEGFDSNGVGYSFDIHYASQSVAVGRASNYGAEVVRKVNSLREGASLTFSFSKAGRDDDKQTVLVVPAMINSASGDQANIATTRALMDLVVDDLGYDAPFNALKIDSDFEAVKDELRNSVSCFTLNDVNGYRDVSDPSRKPPKFFLWLSYGNSPIATSEGLGGIERKYLFDTVVSLTVTDQFGVVQHTSIGVSSYELTQASGKGLSIVQAKEINAKNAALLAIKDLTTRFRPVTRVLSVKSTNDGQAVVSEPVDSKAMASVEIRRPLSVGALKKTVHIPVLKDEVALEASPEPEVALSYIGTLRKGDLLQLSVDPLAKPGLVRCLPTRRRSFVDDVLISANDTQHIVEAFLGSKLSAFNFFETSDVFMASVKQTLDEGFFVSDGVFDAVNNVGRCLVVQESQRLESKSCAADACEGVSAIGSAARIYAGDQKIKESIIGRQLLFKNKREGEIPGLSGNISFQMMMKSVDEHKKKLN